MNRFQVLLSIARSAALHHGLAESRQVVIFRPTTAMFGANVISDAHNFDALSGWNPKSIDIKEVGCGRSCSPRHQIPLDSRNEG